MKRTNKRLHPRLKHELPLKVAANGYDFITTTKDVSCVGVYCHIDKYVPPFTRITVRLTLPIDSSESKKSSDIESVECRGVVIRTEDDPDGGFNIAIFFNQINDSQRQKISKYIKQFLPKETTPP